MYGHALHHGRKHFCHYCLQASSIEKILKHHIKDLTLIGKKRLWGKSKVRVYNLCRFLIYFMPGDNGKQNPKASYRTNIKSILFIFYGNKSVCLYNKFRKTFKTYLGKDAV